MTRYLVDAETSQVWVSGRSTLHAIGAPADGDRLVVEGAPRSDVRTWGLEPPRLGLIKVEDDVEVSIRLEAVPD